MPSGIPAPDVIVNELKDIDAGLRKGEIFIDSTHTYMDNVLLGKVWEFELVDLRPMNVRKPVVTSATLVRLLELITAVIDAYAGITPMGRFMLMDMNSSHVFSHVSGKPSHREIRLGFLEIPDLRPIQAASKATAALQSAMSTGDMWEMNVMKLENLGISIEPIVAYRDFYPELNQDGELRLYSRNHEVWPPRKKLRALCRKDDQRGSFGAHDAPAVGCRCGIYAFHSPDHKDVNPNAFVFGEVYLWGEVLICDSGYRAQFAYPKTIFVWDNTMRIRRWMMEEIEEIYGVPALLVNEKQGQTLSSVIDAAIAEFTKGGGES